MIGVVEIGGPFLGGGGTVPIHPGKMPPQKVDILHVPLVLLFVEHLPFLVEDVVDRTVGAFLLYPQAGLVIPVPGDGYPVLFHLGQAVQKVVTVLPILPFFLKLDSVAGNSITGPFPDQVPVGVVDINRNAPIRKRADF
jgi:hypothetical protein